LIQLLTFSEWEFWRMKDGPGIEEEFLKEVGQRIRKRRNELGISLRELGEDLGLDKGNTQKIENGKNITLKTLLRVAVFLDITPSDLLSVTMKFDLSEFEKTLTDNRNKFRLKK
jgi:transcriptional regulator with XRE-family HTH domain